MRIYAGMYAALRWVPKVMLITEHCTVHRASSSQGCWHAASMIKIAEHYTSGLGLAVESGRYSQGRQHKSAFQAEGCNLLPCTVVSLRMYSTPSLCQACLLVYPQGTSTCNIDMDHRACTSSCISMCTALQTLARLCSCSNAA